MAAPLIARAALSQLGGMAVNTGVNFGLRMLNVDSFLKELIDPTVQPSPATPVNAGVATYAAGLYQFRTTVLAPSNKDIKALNDFFEAYGYSVYSFGTPNIKVRGTFTYIKTADAVVYSSNDTAAQQLAVMLNSGCRFWRKEIGKV